MITTEAGAYEKGIILSSTADFEDPRPMLFATSIKNVEDITYDVLNLVGVNEAEGDYVDPHHTYLAYTFFLKNNGFETVDIEYSLLLQEVYRSTEEAIRFVFIEDGSLIRLFQKPDSVLTEYLYKNNREPDEVVEFTDTEIFRYVLYDFKPEDVKKFSIIIYVEGNDPDCTDTILGGSLKSTIVFTVVDSQE